VLTALSSVDPQPQRRQVAVLGVNGDLAAYTGEQCVDAADRELELLRPMDRVTEPDQLMWRAVVAALDGREDAAREMLVELGACAPQFLEAARRFGKAGLMPADVIERIVPAAI
jgi:hypothetical protein